jgi:hypothetical protein
MNHMSDYAGRITITWPAAGKPPSELPAWGVALHDADTGEQLLTVTELTITGSAKAGAVLECEITALVDENGTIIPGGTDAGNRAYDRETDTFRTGVFRYIVAEMRTVA